MTSIEWLIEKLDKLENELLINKLENKFSSRFYELTKNQIIEQAKEMHKQEIIKSRENGIIEGIKRTNNNYYSSILESEQYYQETFVSKGSGDTLKDYHIVEANEMVELPKQEISDEEIENISDKDIMIEAARRGYADLNISAGSFQLGALWYREQLKLKQPKS
jgi:hypothetical protein